MLTAIVAVETVLLVLLIVLVAALLRSHAEILRRLGPGGQRIGAEPDLQPSGRSVVPQAPTRDCADTRAPELAGLTPAGDAVKLAFDGAGPSTLLAFLSTGCASCDRFWEDLDPTRSPTRPDRDRTRPDLDPTHPRRLAPDLQTVIVTRGAEREQRSKLRSLAPERVPVVMSSEAWEDYEVPGSPYFVLIEDGAVRGEGVATTWQALSSLVGDAIEEQREAERAGATDAPGDRHRRIEETLAAAGIGPDHPSLYPGRGQ